MTPDVKDHFQAVWVDWVKRTTVDKAVARLPELGLTMFLDNVITKKMKQQVQDMVRDAYLAGTVQQEAGIEFSGLSHNTTAGELPLKASLWAKHVCP